MSVLHGTSSAARNAAQHLFARYFGHCAVVGYSQSGLRDTGATMLTPQFLSTSGGSIDLQDLAATGDDIVDHVKIQFLNSSGQTTNTVMWADGGDLDEPVEGYCWSDDGWGKKIENLKIAPGQGLWVTATDNSQALQSSGQVETEQDIQVQLSDVGATACGNPFPYQYDLQEMYALGDDIVDHVKIQFLNSSGQTTNTVMWADGGDLDEPVEGYCWSDDGWGKKIENLKIAPGQGLWVTATSKSQYLVFPHPEL